MSEESVLHWHELDYTFPHDAHGPAIESVYERDDGKLWAGNSEYGTQVNFCPVCGYKAKVAVVVHDVEAVSTELTAEINHVVQHGASLADGGGGGTFRPEDLKKWEDARASGKELVFNPNYKEPTP